MRILMGLLILLSSFPLYSQTAPAARRITTVESVSLTNDSVISSENFQRVVRDIQRDRYVVNEQTSITAAARRALQDQGYFKAEVEIAATKVLSESTKTRTTAVTLRIREGEQYRVAHITFTKDKEFSEAQLQQAFRVKDGDVMSDTKISEGVENIRKLFSTKGYLEGGAVPKIVADDTSGTVAITVNLVEGPQFTVLGLTLEEGPLTAVVGVLPKSHPWPADKAAKLEALSRTYQGTHNVGGFIEVVKETFGEMFPGCNADSFVGTTQGGDPPHATINVIYPAPEECQRS